MRAYLLLDTASRMMGARIRIGAGGIEALTQGAVAAARWTHASTSRPATTRTSGLVSA